MRRDTAKHIVPIALLLLLLTGCDRRELYVYGDEFHSVELEVDWNGYDGGTPDGMTVWFYPLDHEHAPYRGTTASVRRYGLYLPGGRYQGIVVDYSPEEYSHQHFIGMDSLQHARVEAASSAWQPDSLTVMGEGVPSGLSEEVNEQLFGEQAWTAAQMDRPAISQTSGFYTIADQPERMALDTLMDKVINPGEYGDYIPWKERDTYQSSIVVTQLFAAPTDIVWKLRLRVYIEDGYNYLWQMPASVSGLADGHYLPLHVNSSRPCLVFIEAWNQRRTGTNSGYIETTVNTFGLRPGELKADDLRLNLSFVLRDHATVLHYHFNMGDHVVLFGDQLLMQAEIGTVVLPYVDAYNGTGFGADVTPWDDEDPIDIHF